MGQDFKDKFFQLSNFLYEPIFLPEQLQISKEDERKKKKKINRKPIFTFILLARKSVHEKNLSLIHKCS